MILVMTLIHAAIALAQDAPPTVQPEPQPPAAPPAQTSSTESPSQPGLAPGQSAASGSSLEDLAERRDPFKRPDLTPKFDRSVTELETFSTLEYRMVGVVSGARTRAMLLGPNGKTYFVKEGDKIGIQKGLITKITAEKVLVRERISNLLGKEEMAVTEIRLPTEAGVSVVTGSGTGLTDVEYQQTIESTKRSSAKKSAAATSNGFSPTDGNKAPPESNPSADPLPDANIIKKGD